MIVQPFVIQLKIHQILNQFNELQIECVALYGISDLLMVGVIVTSYAFVASLFNCSKSNGFNLSIYIDGDVGLNIVVRIK